MDEYPNKVYLGIVEGDFKQRFYNHCMSINNKVHSTNNTVQICFGSKEEAQDNPITEMVRNQICTSLFKHVQEMSVVSASFCLKFLITPIQTNWLMKDQRLFQSTPVAGYKYSLNIFCPG